MERQEETAPRMPPHWTVSSPKREQRLCHAANCHQKPKQQKHENNLSKAGLILAGEQDRGKGIPISIRTVRNNVAAGRVALPRDRRRAEARPSPHRRHFLLTRPRLAAAARQDAAPPEAPSTRLAISGGAASSRAAGRPSRPAALPIKKAPAGAGAGRKNPGGYSATNSNTNRMMAKSTLGYSKSISGHVAPFSTVLSKFHSRSTSSVAYSSLTEL